jgi:hypothetical protein
MGEEDQSLKGDLIMSDRIATEIRIGGPVRRSLVPDLIDAIEREELEEEWGMALPHLENEQDLPKRVSGARFLQFYATDALWGSLTDLETFLTKNSIAFDRHHGPYGEYSGETRRYRPGMKEPVSCLADDGGNFLIEAGAVAEVRRCLRRTRGQKAVQRALRKLDRLLAGADIPDLTHFEIVD